MHHVILLLAALLAAATYASVTASNRDALGNAPNWATDVCTRAPLVCQYPKPMGYAGVGLAGLWLIAVLI
jgi:hypothetical protein